NQTTLSATADGSAGGAAAKGGSFASAVENGTTRASIQGQAAVNAASIDISATSTDSISTLAKSASGGATQNDADTQQQLQNNNAKTSDGSIAVAGAFALTQLQTRQTEASVTSTGAIVSRGSLHIGTPSSPTSTATADG